MSCLCEDLISEIFERLPPKTLLRFRSLSKSWFSRISSRKFVLKHTLQSPQRYIVRHLIDKENEDSEDIYSLNWHFGLPCPRIGHMDITSVKFPVGHDGRAASIVGSSNGIICLYHIEDVQVCFYLWNFSIRRKLTLGYHPFVTDSIVKGNHDAIGFGYDQINDDYKIVFISYSKHGPAEKTLLYSMKIDSWSEIAFPTSMFLDVKSDEAVLLNGVLHWLVKYSFIDHMIMTFDLSSNVFGSISLPEPSRESNHLTTISNYLYVWSIHGDKSWLWRMNEYNNVASWSVISKDIIQSNLQIEEDCSCEIVEFMHIECLELLDKGTACGETFMPIKDDKKKENSVDEGAYEGGEAAGDYA